MKTASFIASRIFSMSKESLSSTVMRLAITSVALGVTVMIISIAVVIGFKHQIRDKVIGFIAPLHVQAFNQNESMEETPFTFDSTLNARLSAISGISDFQPSAHKVGMIKTDDEIQGVVLKGVGKNYNWRYISGNIVGGEIPVYNDSVRSTDILVSKITADKMKLNVGDAVRMWFIDNDMQLRGRRFTVSGIYETGLKECDERFVYCDISQIKRLNNWNDNQVGHIEIWLDDGEDIQAVNSRLYYAVPPELVSYTAMQSYPHIFDWLNLLDMNVVIIIALMFLVAGITIVSMLLIIILEKTSTIGLLKAMGASSGLVRRIFMLRSCRLLGIGMAAGNVLGIAFCLFQKYTHFISLPAESYYLSSVPIEMNWLYIIILNIIIIALWILMLLIPMMIINRINPSKSIRFE